MYTIAINSVGVNGTIPDFVQPGACILASTYGEGHNSFEDCMVCFYFIIVWFVGLFVY